MWMLWIDDDHVLSLMDMDLSDLIPGSMESMESMEHERTGVQQMGHSKWIYPLVMTNIAMEAMAHRNRWFTY